MNDELKNTYKINAEVSDYAAEIHPTGPNMEEHVIEVMEHMNVGNEKYVRHHGDVKMLQLFNHQSCDDYPCFVFDHALLL